jgi:hypothetical protein
MFLEENQNIKQTIKELITPLTRPIQQLIKLKDLKKVIKINRQSI